MTDESIMRSLALTLLLAFSLIGNALASSSGIDAASEPQSILVGPSGIIWRTAFEFGNHLVEELPSGCARVFQLGRNLSFYSDIAMNGAHSVAVVDALGRRMYVESGGAIRRFDLPRKYGIPFFLTGAADDSFWVAYRSELLKVQNGQTLEARPFSGQSLTSIRTTPDYRTLVLGRGNNIGRLGPDGRLTWSAPLKGAVGFRMAVADSGAVWAISQSHKMLFYEDAATGIQRAFPLPNTDTWPSITLLPDGTLLAAGTTWIRAYRPDGIAWSAPAPHIEFMGLAYDTTRERPIFVATGDRLGYIDLALRTATITESTWVPSTTPCPGNDPAPFW